MGLLACFDWESDTTLWSYDKTSFKDLRHGLGPPVRSPILASSLDTTGLLPSGHTKMHEANQKTMMKCDPQMAD